MPSTARCIPLLLSLALGASGAGPAAAQESGFFSRFMPSFGAAPADTAPAKAPPAAPAAPKPVPAAVPEIASAPTDANPFNGGSGGLINAMRGAPSTACDGILCTFMGGETAGRPPGPAPSPAASETADQAATMASARSRPVDDRVSPRKDRCAAPANDPWRCYR